MLGILGGNGWMGGRTKEEKEIEEDWREGS